MNATPDAANGDAWAAAISAARASASAASQAVQRLERSARTAGHTRLPAGISDDPDDTRSTPTMFLRGAGVSGEVWASLKAACSQHGWAVVRDRRQAWHLARGRIPTVMIDFTDNLVTVGKVRAVYSDDREPLLKRPVAVELGRLDLKTLAGVQMLVEAIVASMYESHPASSTAGVQ